MTETSRLNVLDAIQQRRAVRSFRPDALSETTIRALLEAVVRAPTAIHREPWAFVIIQDRALLRRLSDRVKASWRAMNPATDPHLIAAVPEARGFLEALARPDFNVFYDAGTLILICVRPVSPFIQADAWLGAENLMLAACDLGLGTCVIGAAIDTFNQPEVKAELGIPPEVNVIAPVIVGVPSGSTPQTSRRVPEIIGWKR